MGKSFQIMSISGIPLKIHWSFPLLFAWILFQLGVTGIENILIISSFILSLFVCVILHELGHAFAARRYGVNTVDIIISPIGGVARLTKLPTKPIQEFVVAIAGPLVNVAIALIIGASLFIMQGEIDLSYFRIENISSVTEFLVGLLLLNITLVIFNLVPAFPMDGGRIFRSLLSMRFSRVLATRLASGLGQVTALVFIGIAIYDSSYFMLAVIGVFVFFSAAGEYRHVKMGEMLKSFKAEDLMRTQFTTFPFTATIDEVKENLMRDTAGDYLINDENDEFMAVLTRGSLIRAVKQKDFDINVLEYASNRVTTIHPSTSVSSLFERMQEEQLSNFIIKNETGEFLGMIDMKGMNEFLKYQSQLARSKRFGFLNRFRKQ